MTLQKKKTKDDAQLREGGRIAQRGRSERGTTDRTESFRMRKTGKRLMFRRLHLIFGGSGVQFLFIFCMPSMKERSELMDRELAGKVACKYGRNVNGWYLPYERYE